MKQIIVNVSGLTIEEKQRVNEALAKIFGFNKMNYNLVTANWMYAPSPYANDEITYSHGNKSYENKEPTHTPQQVLEMAGMAKQGHVHAHLMAMYAEDAKTNAEPWKLWQMKTGSLDWIGCKFSPEWDLTCEYRRKPKTHIVHGVEISDLRINPKEGEEYYTPNPLFTNLHISTLFTSHETHSHRCSNKLCYEPTEEGKQAAIRHAKAWLGEGI